MKKYIKNLALVLCLVISALMLFTACNNNNETGGTSASSQSGGGTSAGSTGKLVDYVSQVQLDFANGTKKQEVTVRLYIDGDTTHFDPVKNSTLTPYNAKDFENTQGYIKARYLAANTPENTGDIEEWGAKAAEFTEQKLKTAKKIIVESDNATWNIDSTGERYTVWIWYLPQDGTEYRNLNIEILQEGLARGSSTANNRYGDIASKALAQAREHKLVVFSEDKDPDYDYGNAKRITLKELRANIEKYNKKKVKVDGVVSAEFGNSVYIEDLDKETGVYFGMAVYYGFTKNDELLNILSVGNRVTVVGTVTAFQDSYQISGVTYSKYDQEDPDNCALLSKGNKPAYVTTEASKIVSGKLDLNFEKTDADGKVTIEKKTLNYGEAIMSSTVTVENLKVTDLYTTHNGGDNDGAISITCQAADGTVIVVRTEVLEDENGKLITQDQFANKTITVKGLIEKYEGQYQVKVYRADQITIIA